MSHSGTAGEFNRLAEVAGAELALLDLCKPFARGEFRPECVVVHPNGIPAPEDELLVHHSHMTVVLERHHGHPVDVRVLEEHLIGDSYTRKISLTPHGSERIVEWGIARLNLQYVSQKVREEILARQTPLGAILIKHQVHRRIKPRYFVRFPSDGQVLQLFGDNYPTPAYGRLGTIFCDGAPAIELLEIVINTEKQR